MAFGPGSRIGPYEVTTLIGEGGMGKVWRARHIALKRDDALKVLPEAFASDPDRLARFQREAQVLASLNHPNIAHVHGLEQADGVQALVMELVEGPTLAARIAQGPIPVAEALPIARQIAEALESAHEGGIIHRDLKPANIKVRPDDTVKVLDFGLAKALGPPEGGHYEGGGRSVRLQPDLTASPTITSPAITTGAGTLLGTAAYMSPEQARGKAVDERSDIWAFGCVLYEMLTGRRAFEGTEVSDVLASVLAREPDWSVLPRELPAAVAGFLRRSLQKDRRQRIHDIGDIRLALEGAFDQNVPGPPEAGVSLARRAGTAALAAVVGMLAAAAAFWSYFVTRDVPGREPVRLSVALPEGTNVGAGNADTNLAISPDGRLIAFVTPGQLGGTNETLNLQRLYVRNLDDLEPRLISGTNSARAPFFSPDGQWIGYFDTMPNVMKKVSVNGGQGVTLCEVLAAAGSTGGGPRGASWGPGNSIVFATNEGSTGLLRVSAAGGTPEVLTTPKNGEGDHYWPEVLPDGRAILFTIVAAGGAPDVTASSIEDSQIAVLNLQTGEQKVLIPGGSHPRYVASGHIVYGSGGALWAVGFSPDRLEVVTEPVPVVRDVVMKGTGAANFSAAQDGTLVYLTGPAESGGAPRRAMTWVDRDGRARPIPAPVRPYVYPRISPDGARVLVDIRDQTLDLWAWDFARSTLTRVTFGPGLEWPPLWTPDGRRVLFSATPPEPASIFWQPADGTGAPERIVSSMVGQFPAAFSPDGKRLVVRQERPTSGSDLGIVLMDGDRQVEPLIQTPFNDRSPDISPDGRWVAYQSDESGRFEVYVRPFPDVNSGRWLVSTNGGVQPVWARNGTELFYIDASNTMTSVPIRSSDTFTAGRPISLFKPDFRFSVGLLGRTYDVAPDGRFLFFSEVSTEAPTAPAVSARMVVVLNWLDELKRLVPVN